MYHSISLGALLNPIEHSKPKVFGFERKSAAFSLDKDECAAIYISQRITFNSHISSGMNYHLISFTSI